MSSALPRSMYVFVLVTILGQGCAYRVAENAVLTHVAQPASPVETTEGKEVEGDAYFPYLIGFNIREAVNDAFDNAGPEYDLIVNATVDVKHYYVLLYFSQYVLIRGKAVKSSEMRAKLGEEKYQRLLVSAGVLSRSTVQNEAEAEEALGAPQDLPSAESDR